MKKKKEFISVQEAQDYKEKNQRIVSSLKIPFILSIPVTVAMCIVFTSDYSPTGFMEFLWGVLQWVAMLGLPVVYGFTIIKGGKLVLKTLLKVMLVGFIVFPFPISLVTGLIAFCLTVIAIIIVPTLIIVAVWWQATKEIKVAEKYIKYSDVK